MSKQTKPSILFPHGMISTEFMHSYNALANEIADANTAVITNARSDHNCYRTKP
jgi:hypothetical protein